jgi:hypothetical protein
MSGEQDQIRSVAERVARSLTSSEQGGGARGAASGNDLSALRAGLDEIQRRLAHIESHIQHDEQCEAIPRGVESPQPARAEPSTQRQGSATQGQTPARSLWLSGTYMPATAEHPSQERFDIGEAVSEIVDFFEREKTCSIEPGGKPCDHCGMCSSRGF